MVYTVIIKYQWSVSASTQISGGTHTRSQKVECSPQIDARDHEPPPPPHPFAHHCYEVTLKVEFYSTICPLSSLSVIKCGQQNQRSFEASRYANVCAIHSHFHYSSNPPRPHPCLSCERQADRAACVRPSRQHFIRTGDRIDS